jgi:multimeric flavodoxin WrbA
MKVLGIQTSPNIDGLTASMAMAALEGAEAAGAEPELVHLRKLNMEACRACDNGWGLCRSEQRCIIEDDFQGLRDKMGEVSAIVVSTPVYFGEVSEVTKSFFDRLRRCEFPLGEDSPIFGKPVIGISAAGGSGGGVVTALRMLEGYFQRVSLRPFDLITVTRWTRDHKLPMTEEAGRRLMEFMEAAE